MENKQKKIPESSSALAKRSEKEELTVPKEATDCLPGYGLRAWGFLHRSEGAKRCMDCEEENIAGLLGCFQ